MKRHWETDELVEHWTLLPRETELLTNKTGATRLGFAVMLKFFQLEAYFPQQATDVPTVEIPCNTCEEIDIAFAYGLGKFYCFADTYVKFGYRWFLRRSDMILSSVGSFAQAISGGLPSRRACRLLQGRSCLKFA
jgi:Domain of unknown function (DUF4158)